MKNNEQMIYVHIPFCNSKCYYCSFVSCTNFKLTEKYFQSLKKEILKRKNDKVVSSIYFGGGTPSSVDSAFIVETLNLIKENYLLKENCEISIECNPNSTTKQKLKDYFVAGFNRISFGVQSLNEKSLEKIGRFQNLSQVQNALAWAREANFENISVDLLIGLENQTFDDLKHDINTLYIGGIKHISLYMLMIEDKTKLGDMVLKKQYVPASDDHCVDLYESVVSHLKQLGFERYEVSNFAKEGYECKHNFGYWTMKEYLGFGMASHSFENDTRRENASNFDDYFAEKIEIEKILPKQANEEEIMLGLRTTFGVKESIIKNKKQLDDLLKKGVLKKTDSNVRVSDEYFGVLNQIILKLI